MRLATEITIALGGETIALSPTLRAAFHLEQRHSGFEKVIKGIMDGSLTMIADVIAESCDRFRSATAVVAALGAQPIGAVMQTLTAPVLKHVFGLMGIDEEAKPQRETGERLTFAEYHTRLFQIATGHLGWTPDAAWNATPAEIIEASKGRNNFITDLLTTIFGSGKGTVTSSPDGEALDREGLKALRFD
jgi:hypothetical protein